MSLKRIPNPNSDINNWGILLNDHLAQVHNATDGGFNTWLNIANRPTGLTADDQGKTGANLDRGIIEQWTGTAWIDLTKTGNGLLVVNSVFNDLVNINPANTTTVYCSGYWQNKDFGGGIFEWDATNAKDIDGGRFFASKIIGTGRWVRKMQDNINVLHYGAIPVRDFWAGTNGNYGYGGIYFRNDVVTNFPLKPLSYKFASLADAKAWYPRTVDSLADSIDAVAIQSCMEFNLETFIPEGVYVCNKPLQLMRNRKIYGVGKDSALQFLDCSGFVPKQSVLNNLTDQNFIYLNKTTVTDLGIYGNSAIGDTFDDTKCGFNFPRIQTAPDAENNTTPLVYSSLFSNLDVIGFAGHGLKMLSEFTCIFDMVNVRDCGGHGIYIQGGNTTSLRSCYVSPVGDGYASYRILGGACMYACNGNDAPKNTWGVFGQDTAKGDDLTGSSSVHLINCNIEGQEKSLEIRGYSAKITLDNCYIQAKLIASMPHFIFDDGYISNIIMTNCTFYTISAVAPETTIISTNNSGGSYIVIGYNSNYNVKYVNNVGANVYGAGVFFPIPTLNTSLPAYATKATQVNNLNTQSIYLGDTTSTQTNNVIMKSGVGSPEGIVYAPVGSFYLRRDGGANTTMYVKESGSSNTGWVAK
jgi:hypothetical protein